MSLMNEDGCVRSFLALSAGCTQFRRMRQHKGEECQKQDQILTDIMEINNNY